MQKEHTMSRLFHHRHHAQVERPVPFQPAPADDFESLC
jgi:hypothetical protein